jgi:hypothetical protein
MKFATSRVQLRSLALTGALALVAGLAVPAYAQEAGDLQRGVARISLMDGQVSVRRGDSGDWVAGVINAPLMGDDRIAAGPNSRAELEMDSSNVLYLGGTSEIHLTALDYGRYQMELAHGTLTYRILRPSNANIEVDTPSISVRPSKIGTYRISVKDNGETEITVRAGDVEAFTPQGSQWVSAGQTMVARGPAANPEFQLITANPTDEWDRWCDSRGRRIAESPSSQHVPPGVYGTEDMDNAGTWVDNPDYGPVWRPTVPAGWAPYGCGQWVWEDWYGWTWVGCEPWGWAPYHYGRWFWGANYGWLWYPGVLGVRHYWSPALVGFFGFGGGIGFGAGFGFGHVGWVALAPFEVFHPWWGRGYYGAGGFNRGFNISAGNVSNIYRNARAGGVSAVSSQDFRAGRFGTITRLGGQQLGSAGMVRGAMPISPTRANLSYSNRQASYTPRASEGQHFFTHQQPPAVQHSANFAQERAANNAAENRSVGRSFGSSGASPTINRPQAGGTGGWRRFGQTEASPSAGARSQSNESRGSPGPNSSGGYQRFGEPGGTGSYQGQSSSPRYSAPAAGNDRPSYNSQAPRYNQSAPRYSAPQSAPRSSAPSRSSGGGSRPSGGGGHASGGGGGHRR